MEHLLLYSSSLSLSHTHTHLTILISSTGKSNLYTYSPTSLI
jgi:hypothetical protein